MIHYYKTIDGKIKERSSVEPGCWISVISPSQEEIDHLIGSLGIDAGFIRSSLDEEESSRVETEDNGQILLIVDLPTAEKQSDNTVLYSTMPMGIIILPDYVLTICQDDSYIIDEVADGLVKNLNTAYKTRFILQVLMRVAARFLQYLKQIDKISMVTEKQLHQSMKNKELIQLMGLQKSLVYFSTALKSNEITFEKINRGRIIRLYEEDQDLLDDLLIEIKQAIEMCNIYSGILSGTMSAVASIISNNLNIVMKVLTSITIVLAIPTMISSFYGMNVTGLPVPQFWIVVSFSMAITLIATLILIKKGMFK